MPKILVIEDEPDIADFIRRGLTLKGYEGAAPPSREGEGSGRPIELTAREFDLLEFLARNAGTVVSKENIFEKVWGYDFETESDAVKVYVSYLRRKLNAGGDPDLT